MYKVFLQSIMLVSLSTLTVHANDTMPCRKQARDVIQARISLFAGDSYCEIKTKKESLTNDTVSYSAKIACVNEGGFFDLTDLVSFKYEKRSSGKYSCIKI